MIVAARVAGAHPAKLDHTPRTAGALATCRQHCAAVHAIRPPDIEDFHGMKILTSQATMYGLGVYTMVLL